MSAWLARLKSMASHRASVGSGVDNARPSTVDLDGVTSIEIDVNGSPVTMPEADWFICFVPGLTRQWWHRFAHEKHKHVFAIRMVDAHTWLLVEPWWTRLMVNVLTLDEAVKFLRWGAAGDILKVRESVPGRGTQLRGWSNCAVLMAFLLGRSYWAWTPHGLYRRLMADAQVQPVDLSLLLGEHSRSGSTRNTDARRKPSPQLPTASVNKGLLHKEMA